MKPREVPTKKSSSRRLGANVFSQVSISNLFFLGGGWFVGKADFEGFFSMFFRETHVHWFVVLEEV